MRSPRAARPTSAGACSFSSRTPTAVVDMIVATTGPTDFQAGNAFARLKSARHRHEPAARERPAANTAERPLHRRSLGRRGPLRAARHDEQDRRRAERDEARRQADIRDEELLAHAVHLAVGAMPRAALFQLAV